MSAPSIAVTGATGAVGGQVAAALAELGVRQRLVVRDASRAPQLPGADVRQAASYGRFDEMRAALEGVESLLLVSGERSLDRIQQHATAVDAAIAAGVRRVVYLSFFGASATATFERAIEHWHTEEHIRATDLRWTFLRMNLYLDLIPTMVHPDGAIRGPAGDGRLAAVSRADVAAAAVAALTSDGHDSRTYDLTGPESFSLAEAAACMARETGKPIRFENESDEEALESRRVFGEPDWVIRGWVSSYWAIRDGALAGVSPAVRELTGREPISLADYVAANPHELEHVGAGSALGD